MQPLVQGVYNSVMFALIILIAHFMIKNDVGQQRPSGREYMTPEATATLEMQGGDVDRIPSAPIHGPSGAVAAPAPAPDAEAELRRRRRADEQKSMLFAYVQGGDSSSTAPESVMNGGSLGLGDISGYDAMSGYGSFSRAS